MLENIQRNVSIMSYEYGIVKFIQNYQNNEFLKNYEFK